MLSMPEDHGIQRALVGGGGPIRSRGFSQGQRVQRSGGGGRLSSSDAAEARRLWTETPEQRRERIMRQGGDVGADEEADDVDEKLAAERVAARDAAIRERLVRRAFPRVG